jgi:hypothetical protein
MFNNKTSIFTAYAAIAIVGFGGVALLNFAGKSNDNNALIAFLGFYGFFCTTGIFYVLGKQKASIESVVNHINEVNDSHWRNSDEINRRINESFTELQRDTTKSLDSVWVNLDRIESDLEDCRSCTPCSKK